jgi:hypothetical protein
MWVLVIITALGTSQATAGSLAQCQQMLRVAWPQMEKIEMAYCTNLEGDRVLIIPGCDLP